MGDRITFALSLLRALEYVHIKGFVLAGQCGWGISLRGFGVLGHVCVSPLDSSFGWLRLGGGV